MKKIALATLLVSGLMAADSGFYVGADVGGKKVSGDSSWSYVNPSYPSFNDSGSNSISENSTAGTLKVGYYFNKNNRANLSLQVANYDNVQETSFGAGYDYLIGDAALKPFVGALAGYTSFNPDNGDNASGGYFGGQLGVNYAFNENISAEAGFRYVALNVEDSQSQADGFGGTDASKTELKSTANWFIGVNYKF